MNNQSTNVLILRSIVRFYIRLCLSPSMSTDAVDVTPIPYGLVELPEEDRIKEQEEFIKVLNQKDTLTDFIEACKKIGQTAVAIDGDFLAVKDGFDDLVKKYGNIFPKVGSEFLPRWIGFTMAVSQYFLFLSPLNNFRAR